MQMSGYFSHGQMYDMGMTSIQTLVRGSGLLYYVADGSILILTPGPGKVYV